MFCQLGHYEALLCPIVILLPYEAHLLPDCLSSPWLILTSFLSVFLGVYSTCVYVFVWVRESTREYQRKNTTSFSFVSLLCCLFYPLLFAADVRTTFSPITSKGTSCIWTIRWGNEWMHGPLSCHTLISLNALLLLCILVSSVYWKTVWFPVFLPNLSFI